MQWSQHPDEHESINQPTDYCEYGNQCEFGSRHCQRGNEVLAIPVEHEAKRRDYQGSDCVSE
jgi:hypothetical protein